MKRVFLSLSCLAIFFTGLSSPRASETEVEVAGYEGSTTGGWACGPQADVRYGGLAAKVRHSARAATPRQGAGATLVAGAAVEVARARIDVAPGLDEVAELEGVEQGGDFTNAFGGADFRLGYHFHYFGFEAGVNLWSGWKNPRVVGVGFLPELVLSFGPRDFLYAEAGLGVPTSTWLMRPAVPYVTLGIVPSKRLRLEFHGAAVRAGPALIDDQAFIFDGAWYVPIHRRWDLRGSLGFGTELTERQASLGFVYRL